MPPSVGDVVRLLLYFTGSDGDIFINTYTILLTALSGANWTDLRADFTGYLAAHYAPWLNNVSGDVGSNRIEVFLRDVVNAQWDGVDGYPETSINGTQGSESLPSTSTATIVAYPDSKRNWGFRNLAPPDVDNVSNEALTVAAVTDLGFAAVNLVLPYTGIVTSFTNGIYSEGVEVFRPFSGAFQVSSVLGTRVTRKTTRGI